MEDTLKNTTGQNNSTSCHQLPWKWHNGPMNRSAKGKVIYRPSSIYFHFLKLVQLVMPLNLYPFTHQCWTPVTALCLTETSKPLSGKSPTSDPLFWERSVASSHGDIYIFQEWACLSRLKSLSQHCHPEAERRLNPWGQNPTQYSIQHITSVKQFKQRRCRNDPMTMVSTVKIVYCTAQRELALQSPGIVF